MAPDRTGRNECAGGRVSPSHGAPPGPLRGPLLYTSCLLLALAFVPLEVSAQVPGATQLGPGTLPQPDRPTAHLVTIGPGDAVWERFGHNLLWIHDPDSGADVGYNYGLFSFEEDNFILRFVRGQMRYWMAAIGIREQLRAYADQNRSIWIQELALPPRRVRELHAFLAWNERPENRFYRYHYYRDNCSTRVRDALDRVLDGRLVEWARDRATDATYRDHTLRQTAGLFWASLGEHFALGPSVDRPLDAAQAMFIPMELQEHLRAFRVQGEAGVAVSLVRSEWTYFDADRPATPDRTPRWILPFLGVGLLLSGLFVVLGRPRAPLVRGRRLRGLRTTLVALGVSWLTAVGLAGLLVSLMWGFTDHVDTHRNLNLLFASPLHLGLAVLLGPLAGGRSWAVRWTRWLAAAVTGLTAVGLLAEALPVPDQVNGEFVALLAPANLALAWSVLRLGRVVRHRQIVEDAEG